MTCSYDPDPTSDFGCSSRRDHDACAQYLPSSTGKIDRLLIETEGPFQCYNLLYEFRWEPVRINRLISGPDQLHRGPDLRDDELASPRREVNLSARLVSAVGPWIIPVCKLTYGLEGEARHVKLLAFDINRYPLLRLFWLSSSTAMCPDSNIKSCGKMSWPIVTARLTVKGGSSIFFLFYRSLYLELAFSLSSRYVIHRLVSYLRKLRPC